MEPKFNPAAAAPVRAFPKARVNLVAKESTMAFDPEITDNTEWKPLEDEWYEAVVTSNGPRGFLYASAGDYSIFVPYRAITSCRYAHRCVAFIPVGTRLSVRVGEDKPRLRALEAVQLDIEKSPPIREAGTVISRSPKGALGVMQRDCGCYLNITQTFGLSVGDHITVLTSPSQSRDGWVGREPKTN
jgi:hypothetical protein